jgi:hypothetical protein
MNMTNHLNNASRDACISATALLKRPCMPPFSLADGLLHEGLLLLGGHHLVGKSWLMLDAALSVATGGQVWKHFAVSEPQPVLYMSLEDPEWRLSERLQALRPGGNPAGTFEFLYRFPKLNEGGLEKLRGFVEGGRYRLIVIDSLPRLIPYSKDYRQTIRALTDLQDLCRQHPVCLVAVLPLVIAEMESIFDALPTSTGAPSVLWVLKAQYTDTVRTLYIRDNRGIFRTLRLHFAGEHWQCLLPEDEREHEMVQLRQDILELFDVTNGSMHVDEISRVLSHPRTLYRTTIRSLADMLRDGEIVRLECGRYALARDVS